METNNVQQEVLLMTGTTFMSGDLCPKDDFNQQLEEACWNGLIQTMLPEIFPQTTQGSPLWLWDVKETGAFLELDLGQAPATQDSHFSINPYLSLSARSYN